jgi:hypothetical protein
LRAVDDATGIVVGALLTENECAFGYRAPNITHLFGPSGYKAIFINAVFQSKLYQDSMVMIDTHSVMLREDIRRYGIPLALYSDRHTIFRSPKEKLTFERELEEERIPLSNKVKALAELSVRHIKVATPQAKGGVERLRETL